jgi:hypothetical protein
VYTKILPIDSAYVQTATMAEREREADEGNESLDPQLLYSMEYCIGRSLAGMAGRNASADGRHSF